MKTHRYVPIMILLAACTGGEHYGFIATLGNDTTSVERITRHGNHITSDVVEHSPRVIRKHWEVTRNDDGSVRSWKLDAYIANPDSGQPKAFHYAQVFKKDSVITVPWEAYVYGNYELLFELAAKHAGDAVAVKQLQPGYRGFGSGLVRKITADSVTFVTTGLAGTGVAKLDANGRMQHYSGKNTTYKQEVVRVADVGDLDAIEKRFAKAEGAHPAYWLSPRDTMRATVGAASIVVDYSRPSARGRRLLGDVVPYDRVWRTGANKATHMTISAPLTIGNLHLAAGTYTLWSLPTQKGAQLIVNAQTGQWGTMYDASRDVGRIPLATSTTPTTTELFTIRLDSASNLVLEWGNFRWSTPIR